MKMRAASLILIILALQGGSLSAQSFVGPQPWFALLITEKPLPRGYGAGYHALDLTYTNVSERVQPDNCAATVGKYVIEVVRDGLPIAKKPVQKPVPSDTSKIHVKIPATGITPCGPIGEGIKPGGTAKFPLWLSAEYDMTRPGKYLVTVSRTVNVPDQPGKNLTVTSNTLAIIVPQ